MHKFRVVNLALIFVILAGFVNWPAIIAEPAPHITAGENIENPAIPNWLSRLTVGPADACHIGGGIGCSGASGSGHAGSGGHLTVDATASSSADSASMHCEHDIGSGEFDWSCDWDNELAWATDWTFSGSAEIVGGFGTRTIPLSGGPEECGCYCLCDEMTPWSDWKVVQDWTWDEEAGDYYRLLERYRYDAHDNTHLCETDYKTEWKGYEPCDEMTPWSDWKVVQDWTWDEEAGDYYRLLERYRYDAHDNTHLCETDYKTEWKGYEPCDEMTPWSDWKVVQDWTWDEEAGDYYRLLERYRYDAHDNTHLCETDYKTEWKGYEPCDEMTPWSDWKVVQDWTWDEEAGDYYRLLERYRYDAHDNTHLCETDYKTEWKGYEPCDEMTPWSDWKVVQDWTWDEEAGDYYRLLERYRYDAHDNTHLCETDYKTEWKGYEPCDEMTPWSDWKVVQDWTWDEEAGDYYRLLERYRYDAHDNTHLCETDYKTEWKGYEPCDEMTPWSDWKVVQDWTWDEEAGDYYRLLERYRYDAHDNTHLCETDYKTEWKGYEPCDEMTPWSDWKVVQDWTWDEEAGDYYRLLERYRYDAHDNTHLCETDYKTEWKGYEPCDEMTPWSDWKVVQDWTWDEEAGDYYRLLERYRYDAHDNTHLCETDYKTEWKGYVLADYQIINECTDEPGWAKAGIENTGEVDLHVRIDFQGHTYERIVAAGEALIREIYVGTEIYTGHLRVQRVDTGEILFDKDVSIGPCAEHKPCYPRVRFGLFHDANRNGLPDSGEIWLGQEPRTKDNREDPWFVFASLKDAPDASIDAPTGADGWTGWYVETEEPLGFTITSLPGFRTPQQRVERGEQWEITGWATLRNDNDKFERFPTDLIPLPLARCDQKQIAIGIDLAEPPDKPDPPEPPIITMPPAGDPGPMAYANQEPIGSVVINETKIALFEAIIEPDGKPIMAPGAAVVHNGHIFVHASEFGYLFTEDAEVTVSERGRVSSWTISSRTQVSYDTPIDAPNENVDINTCYQQGGVWTGINSFELVGR